jgi:hypothetical protein
VRRRITPHFREHFKSPTPSDHFASAAGELPSNVLDRLLNSDDAMDTASKPNVPDTIYRHVIAWTLLFVSVVGLVVLACVVVICAKDKSTASTLVFNALLPVFGTWVGTLLAFYFSKESLDSANRNVNELTRAMTGLDRLQSVPALEKAIPLSAIYIPKDPKRQQPLTNLQQIIDATKKEGYQRLLVFRTGNVIDRIVHLSAIESFISNYVLHPPANPKKAEELTLSDLIAVSALDQLTAQSFAVVPQSATLADAKKAMEQKSKQLGDLGNCEDVFITQDGTATLPILGWITNDIIIENAKV